MSLHVEIALILLLQGLALHEEDEQRQSSGFTTVKACHGWHCYKAEELEDWLLTRLPSGQEAPFCDFKIIHAEALPDDMYRDARLKDKPFILRNDASVLSLQNHFGRENLVKAGRSHGLMTRVGRSWDIVMNLGEAAKSVTLSEFVTQIMRNDTMVGKKRLERSYALDPRTRLFDLHGFVFRIHPLVHSFNMSAFTPKAANPLFLVGGPESGVGFHRHGTAVHHLMHGLKRWFFYAPEKHPPGGVRGAWPLLDWLRFVYPELSSERAPMECVQQPGDIIYVPEGWYHAVINLADSVAVSLNRKDLETEAMTAEFDANSPVNLKTQRKHLRKLLKLQPGNREARLKLALSFKSANPVKAVKSLSKVVSQDPFLVDAQYAFANLLAQSSRNGTSDALLQLKGFLREWKPFLENNTLNLQANHMLARFYSLTGKQAIGREYLQWNVDLQDAGVTSIFVPDFKPILKHEEGTLRSE